MIHIGNNIDVLSQYPDNYFDSVVTDPPYGLGKEPDASEVMKSWLSCGYHEMKGSGFMGKEWDVFVPQPLFWKEVYRVVKPGAHVLSFFGTRTYDWGVMAMRFAGFEVRDCIQWIYGSGFPKSHNISKAVDKMLGAEREIVGVVKGMGKQNPEWNGVAKGRSENSFKEEYNETASATHEAKEWEGWGSALKPANEPIVLARKPLEKGLSIAENVLKYGTGGINIDGCRVETDEKIENHSRGEESAISKGKYGDSKQQGTYQTEGQKLGRFPANLILTHHPECECKQNEEIEDWNCHPDCPIKIMDEQSGILKSGAMDSITKGGKFNVYGQMTERRVINPPSEGGASRFFYCAKASKSERNKGLENFDEKQTVGGGGGIGNYLEDVNSASGKYGSQKAPSKNFHPTVKPVKLMQYLVRLITPPYGIVLDPFVGSGTTGIAAKLEGLQFVGIEQNQEYARICISRINAVLSKCHPKYEQQKLF